MTPRLMRAAGALLTVVVLSAAQLSSARAATAGDGTSLITPVVKTNAQFCKSGSTGAQQVLCGLGINVSQLGRYDSFVACLGCGAGSWGHWSKVGTGWVAKAAGPIKSRANVLLVVTEPGHVGSYRLYRPTAVGTPHAALKLSGQGCIAANIPAVTIFKSFHSLVRSLPTVPCTPPKHLTVYVFTAGLNELSTSTTSHAIVFGHASTPMWLTVAQTTSGTCKVDPLAYSQAQRDSKIWLVWHVKGDFEQGFQTHALLPAGRYCVYMQPGAEYEGFPDGWTVAGTYNDYATGDVLTGPAATALTAAGATTVTLSGNTPRTETLDSYDSLKPCPEYSETAQLASFGGSTMQVSGAFTETVTTANFSQSGYVCSYLHDGGITVAMSTDQVSVAGTQLKDQSTYAETAAQAVTPVSDPVGNVGTTGTALASGQTVSVRCILNGIGLAPFDPIWYDLASAPWGDAYYAPAYAFYNNGQTTGSNSSSPGWDANVPFCNTL